MSTAYNDIDHAAAGASPVLKGYLLPALAGLAPLATMLLSWSPQGLSVSGGAWFVKSLSLPVIALEMVFIAIALHRKASLPALLRSMGSPARLALVALLAIMVGTALFAAPSPLLALLRTLLAMLHFLFGWAVWHLCREARLDGEKLVDALMAGLVGVAAAMLLFLWCVPDPAGFNWMNALPGFDNVRRIGYYAAPILGLAAMRMATAKGRPQWIFAFCVSTLAFALILWCGARGALAAFAAGLVIGAMLFPRLRRLSLFLASASSGLLGAAMAYLAATPAAVMGMGRMFAAGDAGASPAGGATSGRWELWRGTLQAIAERPLLGHGESQLFLVVPEARLFHVLHPHNLLLQSLFAWGVLGTLLIAALAAPLAARTIRSARRHDAALPATMGAMVLFFYSAVDGTLFHVQAAGLFALCVGAALAADRGDPASLLNSSRRDPAPETAGERPRYLPRSGSRILPG